MIAGITLLLMAAVAAPACPMEQAHYRLRDQPEVTLRFIVRDTGPDWPSGLLARIDVLGNGHRYWWLPWSGGTDGRQHLASTTQADEPGWMPPMPDDGRARPLGDIDYIATDENYSLLNHVPVRGKPAPAHILLPDLNEALWYRRSIANADAGDRVVRQFFDLVECTQD